MPSLQHFDRQSSLTAIQQAIVEDGACILDGLLDAEFCDRTMADLMPGINAVPWSNTDDEADREFFGLQTKRFHGVAAMTTLSAGIVEDPILLELAASLLERGKRCRSIRVSTIELMVLGQGQANQMLHRDADSWPYVPRGDGSNLLFSANIALSEFTSENGATVVVPGSHKWPSGRCVNDDETCLAVMEQGSALLYSGDVMHGGGSNQTDKIRTGFYIGYIPSWLAPLENQAVSSGLPVLNGFSERCQRLLGVVPEGFSVIP